MKITRNQLKEIIRQSLFEIDAEKAKKMGLKSKGFGNWVDPSSGQHYTTKGGKLHKVDSSPDKGGEGGEEKPKPKPKVTKIKSDPFSGDDVGGPAHPNVPKGAKTSKQAKDMKGDERVKQHLELSNEELWDKYDGKVEDWKRDEIGITVDSIKKYQSKIKEHQDNLNQAKADGDDDVEEWEYYLKDYHQKLKDSVQDLKKLTSKDSKKEKPTKEDVKESKGRKCTVKEIKQWFKSLEENRYKKTYNSDARRVSWLVNNSLSEDYDSMPVSMKKKWPKAAYGRERHLAKEYMKHLQSKQLSELKLRRTIREIIKEVKNGTKKTR